MEDQESYNSTVARDRKRARDSFGLLCLLSLRRCRDSARRSEITHPQRFQRVPLKRSSLTPRFEMVSAHDSRLLALAYLASVLSGEVGASDARQLAHLMSGTIRQGGEGSAANRRAEVCNFSTLQIEWKLTS